MTMTIKRTPEPERVIQFGKAAPEDKPVETQPLVEPVESPPVPVVKPKPRLRKRKSS